MISSDRSVHQLISQKTRHLFGNQVLHQVLRRMNHHSGRAFLSIHWRISVAIRRKAAIFSLHQRLLQLVRSSVGTKWHCQVKERFIIQLMVRHRLLTVRFTHHRLRSMTKWRFKRLLSRMGKRQLSRHSSTTSHHQSLKSAVSKASRTHHHTQINSSGRRASSRMSLMRTTSICRIQIRITTAGHQKVFSSTRKTTVLPLDKRSRRQVTSRNGSLADTAINSIRI